MSLPSFLAPPKHEIEIGGKVLRFSSISSGPLKALLDAGDAIRPAVDAAFSAGDFLPLVEAIESHRELAALLVLDALHDEPWVSRPVTAEAAAAFAAYVDGPTLMTMLTAVAAVNARSFRPLIKGLPQVGVALGSLNEAAAATPKSAG